MPRIEITEILKLENGNTVKLEFDLENPTRKTLFEYDGEGRILRFQRSDGMQYEYSRSDIGVVIYYEDNHGAQLSRGSFINDNYELQLYKGNVVSFKRNGNAISKKDETTAHILFRAKLIRQCEKLHALTMFANPDLCLTRYYDFG